MSRSESIQDMTYRNPLDREMFLTNLILELARTLEEVLGMNEASCFIRIVGQALGEQIDRDYKQALAVSNLPRDQIAHVLMDLNRRIHGNCYLIEDNEDKIVFGVRAHPFGSGIICCPQLCTITSNIFAVIVAENLGYAKVELRSMNTEAQPDCRVVVHLTPNPEAEAAEGVEYLKAA